MKFNVSVVQIDNIYSFSILLKGRNLCSTVYFSRAVIIKESAPAVRIGEHFDRKKLFSDYFRGDEKIADLALDIFSNIGGEASKDEVSYIMKRILGGTGKDADKKD